jgi:glycosyltransferase involved in cell wall biosynthesis
MNSKITMAIWAGNSIGGTEKAAVLFAVGLAARGHRIIFLGPAGPRDAILEQGNVSRIEPPQQPAALADFFRAQGIELIHQHVTGHESCTLIFDTLRLMGDRRPRLIETNVFGGMDDPMADEWVDFRCFVSRANAVQAFQRRRHPLSLSTLAKRTVIFNPLMPLDAVTASGARRREAREELGVSPHEILLLRFGRAGEKWCEDEVAAFQKARRQNSSLRILLMEPREEIWRDVEAGRWGPGIILRRAISDFDRLAAYYSAGDLMLHMSTFGESYGYTIAEAMQHGLPVVVNSTAWRDNAQVELVDHGTTGFVCGTRDGAAGAVLQLAASTALRSKFGAAGQERVVQLSDLDEETSLIEEIMLHLVRGNLMMKVAKRNRDLLKFQSEFALREKNVWELDGTGFGRTYLKGLEYLIYRDFRSAVYNIKTALGRD